MCSWDCTGQDIKYLARLTITVHFNAICPLYFRLLRIISVPQVVTFRRRFNSTGTLIASGIQTFWAEALECWLHSQRVPTENETGNSFYCLNAVATLLFLEKSGISLINVSLTFFHEIFSEIQLYWTTKETSGHLSIEFQRFL